MLMICVHIFILTMTLFILIIHIIFAEEIVFELLVVFVIIIQKLIHLQILFWMLWIDNVRKLIWLICNRITSASGLLVNFHLLSLILQFIKIFCHLIYVAPLFSILIIIFKNLLTFSMLEIMIWRLSIAQDSLSFRALILSIPGKIQFKVSNIWICIPFWRAVISFSAFLLFWEKINTYLRRSRARFRLGLLIRRGFGLKFLFL